VTARGEGSAEVTATVGDATTAVHLTVEASAAVPSTMVAVQGQNQSGYVDEQLSNPLVVRIDDEDGQPVEDVLVQWEVTSGSASLSYERVRSNEHGRAGTYVTFGETAGTVVVRATSEGLTPVDFELTAQAGAAANVDVTPAADTLNAGDTRDLEVAVEDGFGNVITGRTISWSTSDESVASVSSSGTVTARGGGTAEITASVDDASGSATITVRSPISGSEVAVGDTAYGNSPMERWMSTPSTAPRARRSTSSSKVRTGPPAVECQPASASRHG
jgi:trimeric autotransporter adhesin